MDRASDTTTLSPTPFSPFSQESTHSFESGTSDEQGDLGQFATVFRALTELHPATTAVRAPRLRPNASTPSSSLLVSPFDNDNDDSDPVAAYQTSSLYRIERERSLSDHDSAESDTEGDDDFDTSVNYSFDYATTSASVDQPSLGYLDGVLGFIAAERAKFAAQREAGIRGGSQQGSTSENAWRHVIEPRRKRRRKRGKHGASTGTNMSRQELDPEHLSVGENEVDGNEADGLATPVGDAVDGSSSDDRFGLLHGRSMPATPPRPPPKQRRNGKQRESDEGGEPSAAHPLYKLSHSRSTPSLRLAIPIATDSRVLRLRALATKLRMLFPDDARLLASVLLIDGSDGNDFIDPRGRPPEPHDTLIHVFIDHSNILIGFLNYLKRFPMHQSRRARTHISHAALALILERGRPISRRVLATSSPLYQPMESAEQLGYEVRVYARVPDMGDGADRLAKLEREKEREREAYKAHRARRNGQVLVVAPGHSRKPSTGSGVTADSDPGSSQRPSSGPSAGKGGHSRSSSLTAPTATSAGPSSHSTVTITSNGRVRYREQGVDELLQLKLHQAIADVDVPPAGATIVLATGDGNVSQFNEDGFRGAVRTALKKGWHVELVAWEQGLSKAWAKEFGASMYGKRFVIIGLEQFAHDLLEIP